MKVDLGAHNGPNTRVYSEARYPWREAMGERHSKTFYKAQKIVDLQEVMQK